MTPASRSMQAPTALIAGVYLEGAAKATLVERPRLVGRIKGASEQIVLLNAPAGYGKSSLLAQWASQDRRPFTSVTLREAHNDPILLLAAVLAALDQVEAVPDDISAGALAPEPSLMAILPRLERTIHDRQIPSVLVLDELEHIVSDDSLRLISAIAENIHDGSQLGIATRTTKFSSVGRLRANRRVAELGRDDLAMTRLEARELFSRIGLQPSREGLDLLLARTEGWPAALYLAGLSLRGEPNIQAAITRFGGDERSVVDYITEEFLHGLPRHQVEFLTRVSLLGRLTGDLCDAALSREGSARLLRDLARQNMLVIPMDRTDQWYRLHPLFSDMLGSELKRVKPDLVSTLHSRASEWWEDRGDSDRAIDHAIAAGELDRVGRLVWAAVPEYVATGRYATLKRWLDQVGLEQIITDPYLSLTVAQAHLSRGEGDLANHWSSVTHGLLDETRSSDRPGALVAGLALADALLVRGEGEMAELSRLAASSLEQESPWLSVCGLTEGIAAHLDGRRDLARERLADGARRAAVWGAPIVQVLSLAQLGLLCCEEGDWQSASILASQSRGQVERSGLEDYPTMALVMATSGYVRSQQAFSAEAAADMRDAVRLLEGVDGLGSWYEAETRAALAATAARLGDVKVATAQLAKATQHLELTSGAPVLKDWLQEIESDLRALGSLTSVDLTPAELRVLRLMPTHLSFRQMGAEFQVSVNTVRSQAQSVYRKLGVGSKSEAIEKARAAGLLEDPPPSK